ncbi:Thioredoxin-related transmembrane protein 2-like protein [Aphelenchoides fujianensis]|nr:Thioredoxin-related transmembrane protein 2-like protein [Aphelenchoides fujianensis]
MRVVDKLTHLLHPYYVVNIFLSLSFLLSKGSLLWRTSSTAGLREHEILLLLAVVIVWKNRKSTNWLHYLNTIFLFSKVANIFLFFRESVIYGSAGSFLDEPIPTESSNVRVFVGTQLHEAIESDYSVIWVVNFYSAWSTECRYLNPVFSSLADKYSLPNLRFAKLDVGRYPKEGERFRINTHVMSKQLPSVSVIRGGKQVNRRPVIGSDHRAVPFKFTEDNCIREFQLNELHAECQQLLKKKKKQGEKDE